MKFTNYNIYGKLFHISAPQNMHKRSESSFSSKIAYLMAENGISSLGSFSTTLNISLV